MPEPLHLCLPPSSFKSTLKEQCTQARSPKEGTIRHNQKYVQIKSIVKSGKGGQPVVMYNCTRRVDWTVVIFGPSGYFSPN